MQLFRKPRHMIDIGVILVVVGWRVEEGRLDRFIIVCVRIHRGVVLVGRMVVAVRRVWRRVARGWEVGGGRIGMARVV